MIQYLRKLVRVTVTVISELYRHDRANTVNLGNKLARFEEYDVTY
ncbi:hypothetical protein L917_03305 [Phytophthora nicotianae]|uniref:Uncharacterized protein n=1 Tax=Phytophthora nicotianae TaxID=4792 RepID=W2LTB8_PHYNI|nr:hypothetical protein L917_03305 [Phytophthora nicotianae]ETM53082.1 hypothetical protein L914_03407 [Phytophthora nicotianae]